MNLTAPQVPNSPLSCKLGTKLAAAVAAALRHPRHTVNNLHVPCCLQQQGQQQRQQRQRQTQALQSSSQAMSTAPCCTGQQAAAAAELRVLAVQAMALLM